MKISPGFHKKKVSSWKLVLHQVPNSVGDDHMCTTVLTMASHLCRDIMICRRYATKAFNSYLGWWVGKRKKPAGASARGGPPSSWLGGLSVSSCSHEKLSTTDSSRQLPNCGSDQTLQQILNYFRVQNIFGQISIFDVQRTPDFWAAPEPKSAGPTYARLRPDLRASSLLFNLYRSGLEIDPSR